jgi:type I restriction enzyme S subunit
MHLLNYFDQLSLQPENAQAIRELILDLAIRGHLTKDWRKDNPDVEPASLLLERIRDERERLIKEKKVRKEKPLPEISKEEMLFELPEGWGYERLGNVGDWAQVLLPNVRIQNIMVVILIGINQVN